MVFGKSDLSHAFRGERDWDKHKYLRKERTAGGGVRYIYEEDKAKNTFASKTLGKAQLATINARRAAQKAVGSLSRVGTGRGGGSNASTAGTGFENMRNYTGTFGQARATVDKAVDQVSKTASNVTSAVGNWAERQSVKAEAALNRIYDKAYADVVDSNAYKTATKTVSAGKNWVQNKIRQLTNTATDIYKLGSGQYVKEAYEAMNRNPNSETRAAFQAAQQRYNNSIFGKVRNMIQRIVSAVRRGAQKAKSTAKNVVNTVQGAYTDFRNRRNARATNQRGSTRNELHAVK